MCAEWLKIINAFKLGRCWVYEACTFFFSSMKAIRQATNAMLQCEDVRHTKGIAFPRLLQDSAGQPHWPTYWLLDY